MDNKNETKDDKQAAPAQPTSSTSPTPAQSEAKPAETKPVEVKPATPAQPEVKPTDAKPSTSPAASPSSPSAPGAAPAAASTLPMPPSSSLAPTPATSTEEKKEELLPAHATLPSKDGEQPAAPGTMPKKHMNPLIAVFIGTVIILAAIGVVFYKSAMTKKPVAMQKTATQITAAPTMSTQPNPDISKNDTIDQNVSKIDADMNDLNTDVSQADQGFNDQGDDLSQ